MNAAAVAELHSAGMQELNELFKNLKKPYGNSEILRFNLVYQHIYPRLPRAERLRAERFVDALLDDLEDERLAPRIYGVV